MLTFICSKTLMENVAGIPGSSVTKFYTQEEAVAAFTEALNAGSVARVVVQHERVQVPATEHLPGMDCKLFLL